MIHSEAFTIASAIFFEELPSPKGQGREDIFSLKMGESNKSHTEEKTESSFVPDIIIEASGRSVVSRTSISGIPNAAASS